MASMPEREFDDAAVRLAAIVDSSDDAIVSKDLAGTIRSWNRAAEHMFGFTAAEVVGRSIRIIVPQDRQAEEDEVLDNIRRGVKVNHFETIRRRKDGSLIPVSLTISPIRNARGVVIGASKIARDISEARRFQAERTRLLAAAQEQAVENAQLYVGVQEANRLKDEFLATLSHELRTPLNAILGYSRMIRVGLLAGDRQGRALETIERNATSLAQIVEDVLDVSRIISGKVRLNMQPVELSHVIHEALESVRPAADAKGVRIEERLDTCAGPVSGDPERLQQVVWNLVSNAVKFTGHRGSVQVRLERVGDRVAVTVTDTGIGIAPEFLPYAFERFRQADSRTTRERGGLGLGLAIARHLVELHGGTIQAASAGPAQGATFLIKLPVMTAAHDTRWQDRAAVPWPYSRGAPLVPNLQGIRVLAVDDDRDALSLVFEILRATGAEVLTADSAARALEIMATERLDVLLADLAMPRMDGFELITRVRGAPNAQLREIPAAALTAYARSDDRTRALRTGFNIHLPKPLDPGELMATVAALVKRTPVIK